MTANIVQAEFFHVGGGHSSLKDVIDDCKERIADGLDLVMQGGEARSDIKTVVRFYDVGGVLTRLAQQAEVLKKRNRICMDSFVNATGLRRWWLDRQSRRFAGKILRLKDDVRTHTAVQLREVVQASLDVAVERGDHSFRLMRREESHEITIAAERAKSVWLFVFQPNDLLSDKNVMIANAM
jgi:hypothetical protein